MIRNPNSIVEELVTDYRKCLGERIVCIVMYGSAVTHEFRPGKSDINIALVLSDFSSALIDTLRPAQDKWGRRGVAVPLLFPGHAIPDLCSTHPVEILNIRSNYRVLFGSDLFAEMGYEVACLRAQCRRDLRGIGVKAMSAFLANSCSRSDLYAMSVKLRKKIFPLLKAALVLKNRRIPGGKTEVASAVEDVYGLEHSSLSVLLSSRHDSALKKGVVSLIAALDILAGKVDQDAPVEQGRGGE